MEEFLKSDDFRRYRKRQIEEIVKTIGIFFPDINADVLKGMLEMARKMIQLPLSIAPDEKDVIKSQIKEDMKEFEMRFIRSHLIDD